MNEPLIDQLVDELEPVSRPPSIGASVLGWGLASWAMVVVLVKLTGPLRGGALEQLFAEPRFLFECLIGASLGLVAMAGALGIATPGRGKSAHLMRPGMILLGGWVAAYLYGLVSPALAPSEAGHRSYCFAETLLFALPPLALALVLLRRRAALEPGLASGLAAVAAASLPALAMQLACMYDPIHTLSMHLPPVIVLGATAALLGRPLLGRALRFRN
jgi:hypothetical protein